MSAISTHQANIVIVEDNEDARQLIKMVLVRSGFNVSEAIDGRAAIKLVSHSKPDLILMDFSLPGLDGLAATRAIKADPATADVPIIGISAHCADERWRARALEMGCSYCLAKPIDIMELEKLVTEVLSASA